MKRTHMIWAIAVGGFFLLLDQALKYLARAYADVTLYFIEPWLGWEFLANRGIAFGIPIPNHLLLIVTPFILFGLLMYFIREKKKTTYFYFGLSLIAFGAVSNYIDRYLFGFTTDYLRVFTSVMNVADIMIVVGAVLLFWGGAGKERG